MFTKRLNEYGGLRTMTPVPFQIHWYSIGLPCRRLHLTEIKSLRWSSFIELSLCVKSQKSHTEFQAVKNKVEHTIFAIVDMFV